MAAVRRDPGASDDEPLPPRFPFIPVVYFESLIGQIDEDIGVLVEIHLQHDAPRLRRWAHKVSGGLALFGPSLLFEQCEALRAALRDAEIWSDDVETFVTLIGADLIELRNRCRETKGV